MNVDGAYSFWRMENGDLMYTKPLTAGQGVAIVLATI
jgi:hypothetical protein